MSARRCCATLSQSLCSARPRVSTSARRSLPLFRPASSSSTPNPSTTTAPAASTSNAPTTAPAPSSDSPAIQSFASALRTRTGTTAATEPYAAYGTTEKMYAACCAAGDYTFTSPHTSAREVLHTAAGEELGYPLPGTWHAAYNLPPTFGTWAQLTFLHLHILHLRIRQFPAAHARAWSQQLLDHFFYAAEERMATLHEMETRGIRTRYLKDLFEQWRGAEISYDEGLVRGDAALAAAVWRNVLQAKEDVQATHLAEVVGWMRRAAKGLSGLSDAEFASGRWKFGAPWEKTVEGEAEGMRRPLD